MTGSPLRRMRLEGRYLFIALRLVWNASPKMAVAMGVLAGIQALVAPLTLVVTKWTLDEVARLLTQSEPADSAAWHRLIVLFSLQVAVNVGGVLVFCTRDFVRDRLSMITYNAVIGRLLTAAATARYEVFENAETYDRLKNAYRDAGTRQMAVFESALSMVQAGVTTLGILGIAAKLSLAVLPLILLSIVPLTLITAFLNRMNYHLSNQQTPLLRHKSYLESVLTTDASAREARLFQYQTYIMSRWGGLVAESTHAFSRYFRIKALLTFFGSAFSNVAIGLATLPVLRLVAEKAITVGDFALMVGAIAQIQGQIQQVLSAAVSLQNNVMYTRSIEEFGEQATPEAQEGKAELSVLETVAFDSVSFAYPHSARDAINNVSFFLERGKVYAFVGHNGAGKSTLIRLLSRLHHPTSGTIRLNGQDAALYSDTSIRAHVSAVFQDAGRYHFTAAENIGLGNIHRLDDAQGKVAVAITSGAHNFIVGLPQQYNTPLGKVLVEGEQLSGGQWQKIALARAYYKEAALLLLDEPTASLDAEAEAAFVCAIRGPEQASRITVIITHHPHVARHADIVYSVVGGRLVKTSVGIDAGVTSWAQSAGMG